MDKKFIIKEAWWLDENGNKKAKVRSLDVNEVIDSLVKEEDIRGGCGNVKESQ